MSLQYPLPKGTRQTPDMLGDGAMLAFPFLFRVLDATDLAVLVKPVGSALFGAPLVLGVDYTVQGVDVVAGGTVTFASTPGNGAVVRILGLRIPSRLTSVVNAGVVRAAALERELDALELTQQELRRDVDYAVSLQAIFAASPFANLPVTRGQALLALKANATGGMNWLDAVQAALPASESDDNNIRFMDAFWPIGGAAWAFVNTTLTAALAGVGGFSAAQLAALQAQAVAMRNVP